MAVAGENAAEEREPDETNTNNDHPDGGETGGTVATQMMSRKEKRKLLKKTKRKQLRREIAIKEREKQEAMLNDPEEQMRLLRLEQEEAEKMENDRREFEERERQFRELLEIKKRQQEEEEEERRKRLESESVNNGDEQEVTEDDEWEYVDEGPAEIIWKGNEIIVKKKKVKVQKKVPDSQKEEQESKRPISNPLAPQSVALEEHKSAQEVLQSVAQQVPNFGTEQDKAHCPFHLKTGVCRFGARCSRVHFYPDKSCTILVKNMYNGPGLAWEQDEGLECTDEEIDRAFEEFYEDVHTEFLKFGEIVNFKVCKNASSHLRGNVYVQFDKLESAVLAYQSINARYFAGKQLSCEYVNVARWKVAICGEYMKSRLKTCSRGSACNFIHCFQNPGGDYEWADWDKPAPRYWLKKMAALFGHTNDRFSNEVGLGGSRSRRTDSSHRKSHSDEDDDKGNTDFNGHRGGCGPEAGHLDFDMHEETRRSREHHRIKRRRSESVDLSHCSSEDQKSFAHRKSDSGDRESDKRPMRLSSMNSESRWRREGDKSPEHKSTSLSRRKRDSESVCEHHHNSEMLDKLDRRKSPYADRRNHKYQRREGRDSMHTKNRGNSSDIDFAEGSLDRGKERHCKQRKKNLWIKDTVELSDSSSDERKLSGNEAGRQKKIGNTKTIESKRESLGSEEDNFRNLGKNSCRNRSISESATHEVTIGRDDKMPHKNRRKSRAGRWSVSTDSESDKAFKDRFEDRRHRRKKHRRQQMYEAESSDAASDGDRLQRSEKKSKKNRQRSNRNEPESKIFNSESHTGCQETYDDRRSSSKRHNRRDTHAVMVSDSDGGGVQRSLKRSKKQRRSRSRSKNESELSDTERVRESFYGERKYNHGSNTMQRTKQFASLEVDTFASKTPGDCVLDDKDSHDSSDRNVSEKDRLSAQTAGQHISKSNARGSSLHGGTGLFGDTCEGIESPRSKDRYDVSHRSPVDRSNEVASVSQNGEACFRNASCYGEANTELEQAYRVAAVKRLEEMKKCKNSLHVHSRELDESERTHSHDNRVVADGQGSRSLKKVSGSREMEICAASVRRRI